MSSPAFSESTLFHIKPDRVNVADSMDKPVYNLIIGVETMTKMGIMLHFRSKEIIIDFNKQPM